MSDDKYQQITNMKPDIIRSEPFSPIIVVKVLSWTFFRFEFFSRVVPPDNFQVQFFSLSPNIVVVSQRKQENRNGVSNKSLFLWEPQTGKSQHVATSEMSKFGRKFIWVPFRRACTKREWKTKIGSKANSAPPFMRRFHWIEWIVHHHHQQLEIAKVVQKLAPFKAFPWLDLSLHRATPKLFVESQNRSN